MQKNNIRTVGKLKLLFDILSSNALKKFIFLFHISTKSYCTMKILLLISLALTAIPSTRSTNSSEAYDITSLLNDTITQNFGNMNSSKIFRLTRFMERLKGNFHERFGDFVLGPFQGHFYYFTGIIIYERKSAFAGLRHEFHRNRMALFFTSLSMNIMGAVAALPDLRYSEFRLLVNFENITIYVEADPQHKFSKNEFYKHIDFDGYECNYINSPRLHENVTPEVQHQLETQIKEFSPLLFEFNLQNNEQYLQTLPETYCDHPEEFISDHPLLNMTKTKNYFFISNFTSLDRTLSNITIVGMHNFDSYSIAKNTGSTVSTLTIKDIRGTTNLHYGDRNFTIFPLCFEVDSISITVDQEQQSINVTAHNYTVIETKMNVSLTEYQSKWVMEGIQLAIASSIMPSMKYYRNRKNSTNSFEEHPIVKISTKLSQQFEGSTLQNLYDTWNTTIPESFKAESSIQIGSYIYNISIYFKPKKLKPIPDFMQCNLYNNLQVWFKTYWHGQISVFNTTHKFDDIGFVTPTVFVELVKQNISNEFEWKSFQTSSESKQHYEVELRSIPPNFTNLDRLEIAQKAQQLLISLIKKTFIPFTEPLHSLPLDHCYTPVKIFDDFLPFYADYELPFRVPDDSNENDSFTSKMTNVVITQWTTKSPPVSVQINQPYDDYESYFSDESTMISSTEVILRLAKAEIRMNFNDSSIPFDELHLTLIDLSVQNDTRWGSIAVYISYSSYEYYVPPGSEKASFLWEKRPLIEMKLQGLLGTTFNRLKRLVF